MRLGALLPGTKFTSLTWLGTTSGAPHCKRFLLGNFHNCIMHHRRATRCSKVTNQSLTMTA